MPSRNTIRKDVAGGYYHVYARGISKQDIYLDDTDKDYFLYLFSRHLSDETVVNKQGYNYPNYSQDIEFLTFCLMDNHFHLLFYQGDEGKLAELMRSIIVAYTAYYNRKYNRTGPLFESRYKASLVNKDAYLLHVARYILLNPRSWKRYPYSSINYIRYATEPEWLKTEKLLELHDSREKFIEFIADYEENKKILSALKHELANM